MDIVQNLLSGLSSFVSGIFQAFITFFSGFLNIVLSPILSPLRNFDVFTKTFDWVIAAVGNAVSGASSSFDYGFFVLARQVFDYFFDFNFWLGISVDLLSLYLLWNLAYLVIYLVPPNPLTEWAGKIMSLFGGI